MAKNPSSASCLCGKVTISVEDLPRQVDACHCQMCRRWAGSPLLCVDPVSEISIDGEEHVSVYQSSEWALRAFCKHCGTHLYYGLKDRPHFSLPAGLFQEQEVSEEAGFTMTAEIFVDEQPDYYRFAGERKRLSGADVMAMFSED